MEPMTWLDLLKSIALAMWPVWAVLAALLVVWLASRFGYMAPDEYEEPAAGPDFDSERARRYHGDDSFGR